MDKLFPALREAIQEGRAASGKPTVEQHHIYRKIIKLKKPNSSVPGGIPKVLIKDNPYEFAKPASKIFNRIVQIADWSKQWRQEHITVPKSKTDPPQTEDDRLQSLDGGIQATRGS